MIWITDQKKMRYHIIERPKVLWKWMSNKETGCLFFCLSSVPPSLSGVVYVVVSTAAAYQRISPPLYISSVCGVLRPPPTTASLRPATATRWWFAVDGNQGQGWGRRERGLNSQCQLYWREIRKAWGMDRWKEPKLLTSKPGITAQWNHHPRRQRREGEERDRRGKKVGERSKKIRTGKEIFVPLFIFDTCSQWLFYTPSPKLI